LLNVLKTITDAEREAEKMIDEATLEAEKIKLEANDKLVETYNKAYEETIAEGFYLSGLARKIYLVSGIETPKFQQQSLEKLLSKENVEHLAKHELTEIIGESAVEKVSLRSSDGKAAELDVQGVFIAGEKTPVGTILAATNMKTDSSGCIEVDGEMRTNLPGVYAAGDITCGRKFQIAVSVGQGVTAALSIIKSHAKTRRKPRS